MSGSRRGTRATLLALVVAIATETLLLAVLFPVTHHIDRSIPALVLLVPIAAAGVVGGWRAAVPAAMYAGIAYAFAFIPPVGAVRFHEARDVLTVATFLAVGVSVGVLAGRQGDTGALDARRAQLLRAVSHDLRNPLHTIQAATSDLLRTAADDERTRTALLGVVAEESRRLDRIVGNMLSASRIQAGALLPRLEPEHLPALVHAVGRRLGRTTDRPIEVVIGPDVPDVMVDAVQIDQVLTNLVENAARSSPPGRPITVRACRQGRSVAVAVTDDGPGFDAAVVGAAPVPYHHDRSSPGLGLGLTVCLGIVEAHGGTLTLGNRPGGGACVTFTVPVAD